MCSHGLHPSILHLQADDSYTCTLVGITIAVGTTCMIGHCHVLLLCWQLNHTHPAMLPSVCPPRCEWVWGEQWRVWWQLLKQRGELPVWVWPMGHIEVGRGWTLMYT